MHWRRRARDVRIRHAEDHGQSTAVESGIDWRPDLALLDARSIEIPRGMALIDAFRQAGVQVCVIDATDNDDRLNAWLRARNLRTHRQERSVRSPLPDHYRPSAKSAPRRQTAPRYLATLALTAVDDLGRERLELFGALTEREQGVLAELIEGHCAETSRRGLRLNLYRSITDQGDTSEAGRQLAAGRSRNGAACRLVIRGPLWNVT